MYPSAFLLQINKDEISLTLNQDQVDNEINKPTNLFIGNFIVTAYVSGCISFNVKAYTQPQYLTGSQHFLCISSEPGKAKCTLGLFANKDATGNLITTEVINNQIVMEGTASETQMVFVRKFQTFTTYIDYDDDDGCITFCPIYFVISGA